MPHDHPVQEREKMEARNSHAEKKTRKKTELPSTLYDEQNEQIGFVEDMSLEDLVLHSKRIGKILESISRLELERRAIRKAIIAKA